MVANVDEASLEAQCYGIARTGGFGFNVEWLDNGEWRAALREADGSIRHSAQSADKSVALDALLRAVRPATPSGNGGGAP